MNTTTSNPIKVAIVYDFDGTLAPTNMQEYGMLQALGYDNPQQFWELCDQFSQKHDAGGILAVQYMLLAEAKKKGISPTREWFKNFGNTIELYPGVLQWYERINHYASALGIEVQHFIDSSGLTEMIEGTPIAQYFTHIYACSYIYNEQNEACWPAVAVDYSAKVQFLAKISKGIREVSDSKHVNEYVSDANRAIPMSHIIYIGDGETDVPSMRMVKGENGYAIAVYKNDKKHQLARQLMNDGRIHFACSADYREGSEIDQVVKHILDGIALRERR